MTVIPAQVFHASEYVAHEAASRGWDLDELARRVGGDFGVARMSLEIYALQDPGIRMGEDGALGFARAFGTSSEVWRNLEAYWLAHPAARASPDPAAWEFYGMDDEISGPTTAGRE